MLGKIIATSLPRRPLHLMARQPSFSIDATEGLSRTGVLRHARGQVETPALLLYTRRGSPLCLTPDVLQQLGPEGQSFLVDATQFLGNPTPETVAKHPGGGRGFCGLHDKFLVVTGRDSTIFNYPRWKKSTNSTARVEAFAGGHDLTPARFLSIAEIFDPDLLVPIADEIPAEADRTRVKSSVDRTLRSLPASCLVHNAFRTPPTGESKPTPQMTSQTEVRNVNCRWLDATLETAAANGWGAGILAPIQGGTSLDERRRSAAATAERSGVFGYAICGLSTGEAPEERTACIQAAVAELPAAPPKLLQGTLTPDAMLGAISLGVDLYDATYASQVTAAGCALDFEGACGHGNATNGHDDLKVNLWDAKFRKDTGSLVPGCSCFACSNHTRAYVHHLLNVHEMTAQVLLDLHNLHQMLLWFGSIRGAIREGKFSQLQQDFADRRHRYRKGAST